MARLSRIVVVNVPHHVTQRGNARQFILAGDGERLVYLNLLRKYVQLHELSLLGYCLMSNHVHFVVVPRKPDALALSLKQTHGRYASYWNAAHRSSGHVWQGRFYSCPLDSYHLWVALRYVELNPVRAGLVAEAESWPWSESSSTSHIGIRKITLARDGHFHKERKRPVCPRFPLSHRSRHQRRPDHRNPIQPSKTSVSIHHGPVELPASWVCRPWRCPAAPASWNWG